jgi:hypothetical protein
MLKMIVKQYEKDEPATARCGRGGCGELLGSAVCPGLQLEYGDPPYAGPAWFGALPGAFMDDKGIIDLPERVLRQHRNYDKLPTDQKPEVKAAWSARVSKRRPPSSVSPGGGRPSRRLSAKTFSPPVSVRCPKCGWPNYWDGKSARDYLGNRLGNWG